MNQVERSITDKISAHFDAQVLQITNESYMHSVPEGSESHFKLVIVCGDFEGQRLVQRHQSIYRVLAAELAGPIHALALHTYSPSEWLDKNALAPESPNCLGANKQA